MSSSLQMVQGRFLVKGHDQSSDAARSFPVIMSDVSLSFWGGIDPLTGIVIDASHPLAGQCVRDCILCLPSGRGSCTASQVLLELILNGIAPRAIVLRDPDGLACVGALIAHEVFGQSRLDILCVGEASYQALLATRATHGCMLENGALELVTEIEMQQSTSERAKTAPSNIRIINEALAITLTEEESQRLHDCATEAERMALRVVFRYARLCGDEAPSYVDVAKAHIDGCTYIGPGGLAFVRRLIEEGGKVKVPTTLNAMSTDRQRWKALGVPQDYATNAVALGDAYLQLGCAPSFTCAPYLLANPPQEGEDVVWGESNAVVFANSVLGARTEKYADYLDICCALVGMVPKAGMHVLSMRVPHVVLDGRAVFDYLGLKTATETIFADKDLLFPTLGHLCGTQSDGKVPILIGLENWQVARDHLKSFCAAFGTTGSSPLIHIAGITPEAMDPLLLDILQESGTPVRELTLTQLEDTFQVLDSDGPNGPEKVDLVALGNPHLSVSECRDLVELIRKEGKTVNAQKDPDVRVLACMSRTLHAVAKEAGYVQVMEHFGIEFVNDTCWCMLLDPPVIPSNPSARILTDSAKYAHYGPGLTNRSFRFGSRTDCIKAALTGFYPLALAGRTRTMSHLAVAAAHFSTSSIRKAGVSRGFQQLQRYMRS